MMNVVHQAAYRFNRLAFLLDYPHHHFALYLSRLKIPVARNVWMW